MSIPVTLVRGPGTKGLGLLRTRAALLRWGLVAVGAHLVVAGLLYDPTLGWRRGNYALMVLAEGLRTGAGYRDLYLVGAPLHTITPPAYPSLLALAGILGGVTLYKLLSMVMTAAAVGLTYALARHYLSRTLAVVAALIVAVSPAALGASHTILPGALLLLVTLLGLWSAAQVAGRQADPRRASTTVGSNSWLEALVVLCAMLAFLTEPRGLAFLLATPLYLLLARRYRSAAVATTSAVLVAGLWALYHAQAMPDASIYLRELLFLGSEVPGGESVGLADALGSAASNAWARSSGLLAGYQAQQMALSAVDPRYVPGSLLVTVLAITGWAHTRSPGLAEVFATVYVFLAIIGPPEATSATNVLPIVPILAIYVLVGARSLATRPTRKGSYSTRWMALVGRAMPYAAAILLLAPALAEAIRVAPARIDCLRAYRAGAPCEAESVTDFRDIARWAGEQTPDNAVVISRQPSMFYWYSGRRGAAYRHSAEPSLVIRALDMAGADFAVVDHLDGTTLRYLAPAVRQWPDRFEWVHSVGSPPTVLLRVEPAEAIALTAMGGTPE